MGSCPCCPCGGGYVLRASGEQFCDLTSDQRLQAMAVVSVRFLRLSKQTEQFLRHRNPIRYLHFFTSLPCHLSIGSVITLVQSELSTPVDKYPRASAHQRAGVRGRSPVCMCYATNDGGGKETTQRKRKRKNGAIRIYDGITQSPLTHLTQGGLLGVMV